MASNILNKCITSKEKEDFEIIPVLLNVFEELISKTNETMPTAVAEYDSERKQFDDLKETFNFLTKKVADLEQIANKINDITQLMNETELSEEGQLLIQRAIQELNDASTSLTEAISQTKDLTEEKS